MRTQMKMLAALSTFAAVLVMAAAIDAQPGGKKGDKGPKGGFGGSTETVDEFVAKLMAFNTANNGKLTKEELTDKRLHALFDRADANKDGIVTREELVALYQKEKLEGGGFGGDKGDKGPKGGFGDKKFGKGFKGGGQPGQILPPFVQDQLNLSDKQRRQVADLQKEVDTKLATILTDEQRAQLREMSGPGFGDKKGPPPFGDKKDKKGPPPEDK